MNDLEIKSAEYNLRGYYNLPKIILDSNSNLKNIADNFSNFLKMEYFQVDQDYFLIGRGLETKLGDANVISAFTNSLFEVKKEDSRITIRPRITNMSYNCELRNFYDFISKNYL